MKVRKRILWLTLFMFLFVSGAAVAGTTENIGLSGFLPSSVGDSITFQAADKGLEGDIAGSIVFTTVAGGEFIKELALPDDFWVYKVHVCLAAGTAATTDDLAIKIYGPNPEATDNTIVLFEGTMETSSDCNEVLVYDDTQDPLPEAISPANGPLFLSIGLAGAGAAYIKSVGVEDFSAEPFEIDGCKTGIVDRVLDDGKLLSEVVDEIFAQCEDGPPPAKNHGQFVKCVSHALNDLKKDGDITGREKGKIQRCAARSNAGK